MALMERVATLLRANLHDLMDRTEDPEKMARQLLLDMENQLLQVKTQVALALAHQHLLEKRVVEQEGVVAEWHRKAEFAVSKGNDALARGALERALSHEGLLAALRKQAGEQAAEAEALRVTYGTLQNKLTATRAQCDLLLAQHRRVHRATRAAEGSAPAALAENRVTRVQTKVGAEEAQPVAGAAGAAAESLEAQFARLEQEDRVEQMLAELKTKQGRMQAAG